MTSEGAELTLPARAESVPPLLDFIAKQLGKVTNNSNITNLTLVSCEEVFANILQYAYPDSRGTATVHFEINSDPKSITITFIDKGTPYNPLLNAAPDLDLPPDERDAGGLGIFIIKQSMDHVEYQFVDGKNVLTLTKNIENVKS